MFLLHYQIAEGPLVEHVGDTSLLVGVVSFGYGCGKVNKPGIYSKVDKVLPWIEKMMEDYN